MLPPKVQVARETLDNEFENTYQDYDEDQIGEGSEADQEDQIDKDAFDQIINEFLEDDKTRRFVKYDNIDEDA
jgi:hypothetical protein